MAATSTAALPYHEPTIVTILIQSSFLLLLNTLNHLVNKWLYSGLLSQILQGIAYGAPGGQFLSAQAQDSIVQLGYLGLLLLVYEGGLSTNFAALRANLARSILVALTGVCLPIALSYVLMRLDGASALQAFAAGAALCSTSLGTTFTVLSTTGLADTRMGVILSSAAMMDDVDGLVMVQVISNLGGASSSFEPTTVIRPVFVSLGFVVVVPVVAFISRPATVMLNGYRLKLPTQSLVNCVLAKQATCFVLHSLILIGLVVAAAYAGTSTLFAAYLAGAAISWWDDTVPHPDFARHSHETNTPSQAASPRKAVSPNSKSPPQSSQSDTVVLNVDATNTNQLSANESNATSRITQHNQIKTSGKDIFAKYYASPMSTILQPFFFASIGFSIPISRMFAGSVVWRGFVYAILMTLGKLACGIWLLRMPALSGLTPLLSNLSLKWLNTGCLTWRKRQSQDQTQSQDQSQLQDEKKGKTQDTTVVETEPNVEYAGPKSEDESSAPLSESEKQGIDSSRSKVKANTSAPRNLNTASPNSSSVHKQHGATTSGAEEITNTSQSRNKGKNSEAKSESGARDNIGQNAQGAPENNSRRTSRRNSEVTETSSNHTSTAPNPLSLYPAAILGTAMVARGEIGFLVSSIAQTNGIFTSSSAQASPGETSRPANEENDTLFLIVTWAIMLCTFLGPCCVGLLVRRVKRLERNAGSSGSNSGQARQRGRNVLGVWGVN